ncbi:MAG: hypothetical protein AB8B53_00470 [Flavobacteriales bacterium]
MKWSSKRILIALLCLTYSFTVEAEIDADAQEMTKDLSRSFAVNETSKIEVENKYGDIFIDTWNKDSVRFEIEIVAYSEKEEHLESLIDMVDIEFNDYSSFILVETKIGEDRNILDKAAFSFSKNISGTREVRVNYRIFIPPNVKLSIENNFGDVFIDEYNGEFSLDIAHGDFRANLLSDMKVVKSKYGEVKIDEATGGRFEFSFVKGAELGSLKDVFIKSSSSEIDIEYINELRVESRLDEIYIDNLDQVSGKTNMTKLHIKSLALGAELTSKYGNVRVDDLMPTAERVRMDGSNTDYSLGFTAETKGTFDLQMSTSKEFSTDQTRVNISDTYVVDDKTNQYTGTINSKSGSLRLLLTTKNGEISMGR